MFPSVELSTSLVWSWIPTVVSLLTVVFTYLDALAKNFDTKVGDDENSTRIVLNAWWRIAKWNLFHATIVRR